MCGYAPERFCKRHGGTTVQEAVRLMSPMVDRHAGLDGIFTYSGYLDADMFHHRSPAHGLERFKGDGRVDHWFHISAV